MIAENERVTQILESIRDLPAQAQLELLMEIAALVRASLPGESQHSIMELESLGADLWRGMPAQEYVDRERSELTRSEARHG